MLTHTELLDFFAESAETYRFLSQVFFKELNLEAIEELAVADYPSDTGNAHLDEGYRLVRRYFSFSATDRARSWPASTHAYSLPPACSPKSARRPCPTSRCSPARSAS